MLECHGQGGFLDLAEAGRLEQLRQVTFAGTRQPRFVVNARVELPRGLPEETEGALVAGMIPDGRDDDAVTPGHPPHLGKTSDRIRHEMDHELGQGGVECIVRERQLLRRGSTDVDAGVSSPGRRRERLGWIDCGHVCGVDQFDKDGRERARATAHVEDALAGMEPAKSASCGERRREYLPMNWS